VYVADNGAVVLRFTDGCAQEGYKFQGVDAITELTKGALADPAMDGTIGRLRYRQPVRHFHPRGVAQFQATLTKWSSSQIC
jgi:hypothetical protein